MHNHTLLFGEYLLYYYIIIFINDIINIISLISYNSILLSTFPAHSMLWIPTPQLLIFHPVFSYCWSQEITSNPPSGCIPGQMLCCVWRGEAWPINPPSERLAAGLVLQMLLTSAAAGQPQIPQLEAGGSSKAGKTSFLGCWGLNCCCQVDG